MKKFFTMLFMTLLALCATSSVAQADTGGAVAGAITGGALGSLVGKGTGKNWAIAIGAGLGAVTGDRMTGGAGGTAGQQQVAAPYEPHYQRDGGGDDARLREVEAQAYAERAYNERRAQEAALQQRDACVRVRIVQGVINPGCERYLTQ